jgi:hypothetical protein
MSLLPKIRQILVPPVITPVVKNDDVPSILSHLNRQTNYTKHATKRINEPTIGSAMAPSSKSASIPNLGIQRHVTQHPVLQWVAFAVYDPTAVQNKEIVVQDILTHEVIFHMHWNDIRTVAQSYVAVTANDSKETHSLSSCGSHIQSLQFFDPTTLHWSRFSSTPSSASAWQILMVQTELCILLLNVRSPVSSFMSPRTVNSDLYLASLLNETVLGGTGSVPSSNALPLSPTCLLVGCMDGTMKVYNIKDKTLVKRIKGLGKGDYVVQLLSANPYSDSMNISSIPLATKPRRMFTVTKKGYVYLIELVIQESSADSVWALDVQPPTLRFHVPRAPAAETAVVAYAATTAEELGGGEGMEHAIYTYDAHTDKFSWLVPAYKDHPYPTLYVWDVRKVLHLSSVSNANKTSTQLLKPDATMTIHFPAVTMTNSVNSAATATSTPSKAEGDKGEALLSSSSNPMTCKSTVLSGLVHPAFGEDTVVSVTVTSSGDLGLHGAVALAANTTSTILASPCMGIHLKQLLVQSQQKNTQFDESLHIPWIEHSELKVYSVSTSPLQSPGTGPCITVVTNWGLIYLEFPLYSNSVVQCRSVPSGNRHVHFGAGLGSLGKSAITVHHSSVIYGSIDVLNANPVGLMELKNPVKVHESHVAQHMPMEFQRRPFRLAPTLLPSPSGIFLCFMWSCEYRYEIVTTTSLMQTVGQARALAGTASFAGTMHRNIVVASGTGICDFCWISDDDVFAVLHASDLQEQAILQIPKQSDSGNYNLISSPNLKLIGVGAMGVATLAKNVSKTATTTAQSATKLATSAAVSTTMTVTKSATTAANKTVGVTTKAFRSGAKGVTKGVKKSFGIFGKRKKEDGIGSIATSADDYEDDDELDNESQSAVSKNAAAMLAIQQSTMSTTPGSPGLAGRGGNAPTRQRYVELKKLDLLSTETAAQLVVESGAQSATCTTLGELSLRGGNRKLPTMIFGGPVLCVASLLDCDNKKDGYAHFYSRKILEGSPAENGSKVTAAMYQATGPVLPYPDLVVWDDDGRLCAVVVENRVAMYISNEPVFELLGTVRIGSPSVPIAEITSAKFVHGALFCCTYNSVHCVLMGDLEGGVCQFDSYLLASTDVSIFPETLPSAVVTPKDDLTEWTPSHRPLPLVSPSVLGYQSGSLIISTLRGIQAIPLSSPLMRIGLFLAAGLTERAAKWLDAVSPVDHEALAYFLERRGFPDLVIQLSGLSLAKNVDFCMRYGYVDRLEDIVETYGVVGLRMIDMGRGVTPNIFGQEEEIWNDVPSVVVSVGAYLMAHGRIELTRRLATECLRSGGEQGRRDAFFLGALLLPGHESDATRLIQRAVAEDVDPQSPESTSHKWLLGKFIRHLSEPESIPTEW